MREVLGVDGRCEDSCRPERGKRGWKEFFMSKRKTLGLAGKWAAGFRYGYKPVI